MQQLPDVEVCVDAVIARVGKRIRLGTPLGIGKPNHLLNAFYRRAKADPSLDLNIMTALTLSRPQAESDLERRFLEPFVERVFADYPDLDYELDRLAGRLPKNVRVIEFYFYAGKLLGNAAAQRDYISSNYTHVARDLLDRGVNVVAQQVSRRDRDGETQFSLSSNPDVGPDLLRGLRAAGRPYALAVQVNDRLPFMYGDAELDAAQVDFVVDDPRQYCQLFCTPKTAIGDAEFMIGLYASTLIKDGGELQIGIGAIGDALVYALLLRHRENALYRELLARLGIVARFADVIERVGELGPFEQGLFAASEMLVDGFMHLIEAGIIKRKVYDDLPLQRLLNQGRISEQVDLGLLDALLAERAIAPVLEARDVVYLERWGIVKPGLRFDGAELIFPDGSRARPELAAAGFRASLARHLGSRLQNGRILHAGFFLGPESFYRWLRELPEERRALIDMRSVCRINQLYGHEEIDRLHRRNARFVNTGMMVSLLGAMVSDGLESGQVVSGVGGQYNFVAMAHALPDGRSILQLRSTRQQHGELSSNVVYNYGHVTIPRHLRDLVVTEHGIADLRGCTDQEVIERLLAVTDSHFQAALAERAQREGKLAADFELGPEHRDNHQARYASVLAEYRGRGRFPRYPFGTEFSAEELVLSRALRALKAKTESSKGKLEALAEALVDGALGDDVRPYLERMGLAQPATFEEALYRRVLAAELRNVLDHG